MPRRRRAKLPGKYRMGAPTATSIRTGNINPNARMDARGNLRDGDPNSFFNTEGLLNQQGGQLPPDHEQRREQAIAAQVLGNLPSDYTPAQYNAAMAHAADLTNWVRGQNAGNSQPRPTLPTAMSPDGNMGTDWDRMTGETRTGIANPVPVAAHRLYGVTAPQPQMGAMVVGQPQPLPGQMAATGLPPKPRPGNGHLMPNPDGTAYKPPVNKPGGPVTLPDGSTTVTLDRGWKPNLPPVGKPGGPMTNPNGSTSYRFTNPGLPSHGGMASGPRGGNGFTPRPLPPHLAQYGNQTLPPSSAFRGGLPASSHGGMASGPRGGMNAARPPGGRSRLGRGRFGIFGRRMNSY